MQHVLGNIAQRTEVDDRVDQSVVELLQPIDLHLLQRLVHLIGRAAEVAQVRFARPGGLLQGGLAAIAVDRIEIGEPLARIRAGGGGGSLIGSQRFKPRLFRALVDLEQRELDHPPLVRGLGQRHRSLELVARRGQIAFAQLQLLIGLPLRFAGVDRDQPLGGGLFGLFAQLVGLDLGVIAQLLLGGDVEQRLGLDRRDILPVERGQRGGIVNIVALGIEQAAVRPRHRIAKLLRAPDRLLAQLLGLALGGFAGLLLAFGNRRGIDRKLLPERVHRLAVPPDFVMEVRPGRIARTFSAFGATRITDQVALRDRSIVIDREPAEVTIAGFGACPVVDFDQIAVGAR